MAYSSNNIAPAAELNDNPFTLDEPVSATLFRDIKMIGIKIFHVMLPLPRKSSIMRDWDLWGPLVLCLLLSSILSFSAPEDQKALIFALAFCIVWVGAFVVTVNSSLLGGKTNFFQSVCVLGYCIFPLSLVSVVLLLLGPSYFYTKIILVAAGFAWSSLASVGFMANLVPTNRKFLGVYPVFLFYFVISWMLVVSKPGL